MPRIAARARSSLMMASAGISHIVVCVHGPAKLSSYCPSRRVSSYSGSWNVGEPFHEVGLENLPRAVEGVAGEPDQLVLGEPQRARVIELVGQLALVDDIGEPDRGGPVDELEGHLALRMHLPDHLEHQKLIEIGVEQRADRRIDAERVIIDAGGDIRGHYATLRRRRLSDKSAAPATARGCKQT